MPFTSLGSDHGKSSIRRQELKKVFGEITAAASNDQVDLLLISGDLYEHGYIRESTLNYVCREFEKLKDICVLIIPGNHDPLVPGCGYVKTAWPSNVHILEEGSCFAGLEQAGVRIYAGFPSETALVPDPQYINIMLLHGTLDLTVGKNVFNPVSGKSLCSSGMDYIAMGHFHNVLEAGGDCGIVFNPGSPEPLGFDEVGDHGWFMVSITKDGTDKGGITSEFIKSCGRRYRKVDIDVTGCRSDEDIIERVSAEALLKENPEDLFNVSIKGYVDKGFTPDTVMIASALSEGVFFIRVADETLPDFNFTEIAAEPGLRGAFVRKMLQCIDVTTESGQKALVKKALYYGMEAIDLGEIL